MNLPTLIVLLIVAAAVFLALWIPHRKGRRLTDCQCGCSGCPKASRCSKIRTD